MTMLPDFYSSPIHLPFNRTCLDADFRLAPPDADPGGVEGFWLLLRGTEILLTGASETPQLLQGPLPPSLAGGDEPPLYIGVWQGKPCRLLNLVGKENPSGFVAENLSAANPRLSIDLLSLGGTASQILHWEKISRNCSLCGGKMERVSGEWGKKCLSCGYAHYPHIHPCAIVLVRRAGEVLLTRKASWPPGRYSLVAGFLDFGECLEEAAAREVLEETGVLVQNIRYVGSQCWPFPSQLMAGFIADYAGGEVVVEEKELEDARWFPVDALPLLPPQRSIARYILDNFLSLGP
jgi:NAD+ diphosphatase